MCLSDPPAHPDYCNPCRECRYYPRPRGLGVMTITIEEVATKVVVPLVAAFAGAFTAQHFADRNRRRDEVLKEVRSTNAAITDLIVTGGLDLLTVAQLSGTSVAMIEKHYGHLRAETAVAALKVVGMRPAESS